MSHRVGVDIGGTFTDFALFDPDGGRMAVHKLLTTPGDPSVAVLEGIEILLARAGVALADVELVAHGTTLVTNSVIERKGAVTGMLVTQGFRDILDMGLEQRYDLFDLRLVFPDPLVPRRLRHEVVERMRYDGAVDINLDLDSARAGARALAESGEDVVALAVCFLHSYANPVHELAVKEMLAAEFPGFQVSISSEIFANMREYERWTTTTMNAYTQPMFDRYLARLETGLGGARLRRPARHHDLFRQFLEPRRRPALSRSLARKRSGGGRPDVGAPTAAPSACRTSCPSTWAGPRPRGRW